jgi:hypothetical protein
LIATGEATAVDLKRLIQCHREASIDSLRAKSFGLVLLEPDTVEQFLDGGTTQTVTLTRLGAAAPGELAEQRCEISGASERTPEPSSEGGKSLAVEAVPHGAYASCWTK